MIGRFQIEAAKETGQTIIAGMGELHIDIIKRRLRDEYGVEAYLGPLQVSIVLLISFGKTVFAWRFIFIKNNQ